MHPKLEQIQDIRKRLHGMVSLLAQSEARLKQIAECIACETGDVLPDLTPFIGPVDTNALLAFAINNKHALQQCVKRNVKTQAEIERTRGKAHEFYESKLSDSELLLTLLGE